MKCKNIAVHSIANFLEVCWTEVYPRNDECDRLILFELPLEINIGIAKKYVYKCLPGIVNEYYGLLDVIKRQLIDKIMNKEGARNMDMSPQESALYEDEKEDLNVRIYPHSNECELAIWWNKGSQRWLCSIEKPESISMTKAAQILCDYAANVIKSYHDDRKQIKKYLTDLLHNVAKEDEFSETNQKRSPEMSSTKVYAQSCTLIKTETDEETNYTQDKEVLVDKVAILPDTRERAIIALTLEYQELFSALKDNENIVIVLNAIR